MNTAEKLRDSLVRVRRAWPKPDAPRVTGRSRQAPGSRAPVPGSWWIRQAVEGDLARWCDAAEHATITPRRETTDRGVVGGAGYLLRHVDALAEWGWADELALDLARAARALEELTDPARPAVKLGPCPVEVVDPDGTRRPCGAEVRADVDAASDVRCPSCLTVDTAEGWARRMRVESGPVTAEVLAVRLLAVGVRTSAEGVRLRASRGSLPAPVGRDGRGRALYDTAACLAAVVARERHAKTDADD